MKIKGSPFKYAEKATEAELNKAIKDIKEAAYDEFSDRVRVCFEKYLAGDFEQSRWWSDHAEAIRPK